MRNILIFSRLGSSARSLAAKADAELKHLKFASRIVSNLNEVEIGEFSDFLIVGGDGTINHAINQLGVLDKPIGIIPAGSGNDYVKSLNIGETIEEHIETAIHGQISEVDLGRCNDHYFVNGFGLGFDGQIAKSFEENRTILRGHAAYYYHVIRTLSGFKLQETHFTIDGKSYRENLLLMTIAKGTTFGGGFKLTPHANLRDGQLAISIISNLNSFQRFRNIHHLKRGTHDRLDDVKFLKGQQIEIAGQPDLIAHVDGELIGSPPFTLQILPGKLRIRTNIE